MDAKAFSTLGRKISPSNRSAHRTMEALSTRASTSTSVYGDPYDLYLMERICFEAEENDDDASHRLEAAYLSRLRENLFEDQAPPITKQRSSTTTPTSVVEMMSSMSVTRDGLCKRSKRRPQEDDTMPELNAWAIAAAEQAAASAKRARREFWSSATVDVDGLRSLTLR